jgi:hypothetical protein
MSYPEDFSLRMSINPFESYKNIDFFLKSNKGYFQLGMVFYISYTLYCSAVQRSYVLGHNSLMPMEVRAPPPPTTTTTT